METKEFKGLWFNAETDPEVMRIIYNLMNNQRRVRVWFGDNETGKSWNEENDIMGYIGRSTGKKKIPLLVYNKRSYGGAGLTCSSIVKIVATDYNAVLYQHPNFSQSTFEAKGNEVYQDGEIYGRCKNENSAKKLSDFMNGKRMSK